MKKIVAVSGGFDPLHIGHVRMFEEAKKLGNYLVVIVNNDAWLRHKKGQVFMPEKERVDLIRALKCVDAVYLTGHKEGDKDRSVCKALRAIRPDIFANGGDQRGSKDIPEAVLCKKLGIKMRFNVGGGKVQSSSWLTAKVEAPVVKKPWGHMQTFKQGDRWWVKTLTLLPKARISLQSHKHRGEAWFCVDGTFAIEIGPSKDDLLVRFFTPGQAIQFGEGIIHRATNIGRKPATFVEVIYGDPDERDIKRYEDDYGRK